MPFAFLSAVIVVALSVPAAASILTASDKFSDKFAATHSHKVIESTGQVTSSYHMLRKESPDTRPSVAFTQKKVIESKSHRLTWQQAFKEDPKLFSGCTSIFLDVGSNRGTHVRRLFEPEKYPNSPYLLVFDRGFGTAKKRTQPSTETGICAFGFEANPRWTSRLQEIERAYAKQGWRAKWFAPEAVGNTTGTLTFWNNDAGTAGKRDDDGFSIVRWNDNATTQVTVPEVDLSSFMEQLHKSAPPGYRLMKMDIESAEFSVLPPLLTKQLLCKKVLDTITIEWHDRFLKSEASKQYAAWLENQVQMPSKCISGPSTEVYDFDDESYGDDGQPLPSRSSGENTLSVWQALFIYPILIRVSILALC